MSATLHDIVERSGVGTVPRARLDNFRLGEGHGVDPAHALRDPRFSLYCVDHARRRVLFVETPPTIDLAAAPFVHATQFEAATRVIAMDLADLHALAERDPPRDEQITLVFTMGRAGSTLLSAAYRAAPGVVSLSEPDVLGDLDRRHALGLDADATLIGSIRSALRVLCRPYGAASPPRAWVFKLRRQALFQGALYGAALPAARRIYLYRSAPGWIRSVMRIDRDRTPDPDAPRDPEARRRLTSYVAPRLADYLADPSTDRSAPAIGATYWRAHLAQYCRLVAGGLDFVAVRYRVLRDAPDAIMARLCAHSGIEPVAPEALRAVFARDAQAGTRLARAKQRDVELDAAAHASIERALAWHDTLDRGDALAPGTITP